MPSFEKYIRDNVHDYVGLTHKEVEVVSLPVFQRLRHIKQNSTADMTYPGAHHSRFEHCLGTMHIAGSMAENVVASKGYDDSKMRNYSKGLDDSDVVQMVRLAALLHDIGHPPFSHICEPMLKLAIEQSDAGKEFTSTGLAPAEYATVGLIELKDSGLPLTAAEMADVLNIFHPPLMRKGGKLGEPLLKVLHLLISSQLDADRIDYILRDCYASGLEFGRLDVIRLINNITVYNGRLVFRGRAVSALEATLVQRLWLFKHLVYHHMVKATNYLMQSCIFYALEHPPKTGPIPLSVPDFHFKNFVKMDGMFFDDAALVSRLSSYYQLRIPDDGFELQKERFLSVYSRSNMPVALWKNDSDYISLNSAFNSLIDAQIQPGVLALAKQSGTEEQVRTKLEKLKSGDWLRELRDTWKLSESFEIVMQERVLKAVGQVKALSDIVAGLKPENVLVIVGGVIPYDALTEEDKGIFVLNAGNEVVSILKASKLISSITESADPPFTNVYLQVPPEMKSRIRDNARQISKEIPEQFRKEIAERVRARAGLSSVEQTAK